MPSGNIVCNRCGFLSCLENLKGDCPHCGAEKLLLRRRTEYDNVTRLSANFTYDFNESFLWMVAGLTIISMMIRDDPYVHAFTDVMTLIEWKAAQSDSAEVTLEGMEILTSRLENILFTLRRSDLELPYNRDMECVGLLREDIVAALSHAAV